MAEGGAQSPGKEKGQRKRNPGGTSGGPKGIVPIGRKPHGAHTGGIMGVGTSQRVLPPGGPIGGDHQGFAWEEHLCVKTGGGETAVVLPFSLSLP